jgi:hypothetical protein
MCTSPAACKPQSTNRCQFRGDEAAHGFVQGASFSCLPRLRREGGVPILLDFTNAVFQSFEDTSSDKAKNISSSTVGGMSAAVSFVPELQRNGGAPILLEIPFGCDPYFRPFHDTSSDDVNKTLSTTVDEKAHGSGDDDTVRDLSAFRRSGWDPMGHDFSNHVDLSLYMHHDTSYNAALTKRTSRL